MEATLETRMVQSPSTTKQIRKSTPKVRSGCITCKARRVKCDEQKPECRRCLRAKRTCEGYRPDPRWRGSTNNSSSGTTTPQQQQHLLPLEPGSIKTYSIPFKVPGSQADRQLLHYYCCQAAWNLAGYSDPTLWTQLVLQRSHDQPVIRHAIVALSSLHRDFLCGEFVGINDDEEPQIRRGRPFPAAATGITNSTNTTSNNGFHTNQIPARTMSMIAKCHRQLRTYLSRSDASLDVALTCSVIFYTFESLLGDSRRAIWHLDRGLVLLRQCQLNQDMDRDDPLMAHLAALLSHLDVQASCFDDRRKPMLQLVSDAETRGLVDVVQLLPNDGAEVDSQRGRGRGTFIDVAHAEAVLTKLQNWTLHHLFAHEAHAGETPEQLPSECLRERLLVATQLRKFELALNRFAEAEERKKKDQERAQRLMVIRIGLHVFQYLIKENLQCLEPTTTTTTPYQDPDMAMAIPTTAADDDLHPARHSQHHEAMVEANADADLESALAAVSALLSVSDDTHPHSSEGGSRRTYTLSTHLIASLYFLSLKTSRKETVETALALFAHPRVINSRDGLWDARTAAFVVRNLVRVRAEGGDVTAAGEDGKEIRMLVRVAEVMDSKGEEQGEGHAQAQDFAAMLRRIKVMSEELGLPMMQSKRFTFVLREGDGSRHDASDDHDHDHDHDHDRDDREDSTYTAQKIETSPLPLQPRQPSVASSSSSPSPSSSKSSSLTSKSSTSTSPSSKSLLDETTPTPLLNVDNDDHPTETSLLILPPYFPVAAMEMAMAGVHTQRQTQRKTQIQIQARTRTLAHTRAEPPLAMAVQAPSVTPLTSISPPSVTISKPASTAGVGVGVPGMSVGVRG